MMLGETSQLVKAEDQHITGRLALKKKRGIYKEKETAEDLKSWIRQGMRVLMRRP